MAIPPERVVLAILQKVSLLRSRRQMAAAAAMLGEYSALGQALFAPAGIGVQCEGRQRVRHLAGWL